MFGDKKLGRAVGVSVAELVAKLQSLADQNAAVYLSTDGGETAHLAEALQLDFSVEDGRGLCILLGAQPETPNKDLH